VDSLAELETAFEPVKTDEIGAVAAPEAEGELVSPVPSDAPPMPKIHLVLGRPTARWIYPDATGAPLRLMLCRHTSHSTSLR
jgi:hypothetical protein